MIELRHLGKTYQLNNRSVCAIEDINLTIEDGDVFGIIGLSGAGKSTLVRCINYLEHPTAGQVLIDGVDLATLTPKQMREVRRSMSMIFQDFNLLEQRTVLRNICYPLEIAGVSREKAVAKARELLQVVGLTEKEKAFPSQLSGGQKQRVAIARALATDPKVLLCDEATSALDPNTTRSILNLLKEINQNMGVTIIVITHEMKVVEQICNRVAVLDKSHVVECGAVRDVFIRPRSQMARELILPAEGSAQMAMSQNCIRIVFDGTESFEPILANMILECRAVVTILYANTKDIDGKAVGQMVLQLPEDEKAVLRIKAYLDEKGIEYGEESLV